MKKLTLMVSLLILAGCEPEAHDMTFDAALPEAFKDCAFAQVFQKSGLAYVIGRCPNSTTTVSQMIGKTQSSVIIVDGVEYVKKDK